MESDLQNDRVKSLQKLHHDIVEMDYNGLVRVICSNFSDDEKLVAAIEWMKRHDVDRCQSNRLMAQIDRLARLTVAKHKETDFPLVSIIKHVEEKREALVDTSHRGKVSPEYQSNPGLIALLLEIRVVRKEGMNTVVEYPISEQHRLAAAKEWVRRFTPARRHDFPNMDFISANKIALSIVSGLKTEE